MTDKSPLLNNKNDWNNTEHITQHEESGRLLWEHRDTLEMTGVADSPIEDVGGWETPLLAKSKT